MKSLGFSSTCGAEIRAPAPAAGAGERPEPGTQRFARLLGTARALDVILHAHLMTPEEALGLGLVSRL